MSIEPLHVHAHITGSDVPLYPPPAAGKRVRYTTLTRTVVITTDNKVPQLLPEDFSRCEWWVQPLDFDIVVCHSYTQAQASGNSPAATQSNPDGAYMPKSDTAYYGPFKGTDEMFVVSAGNASPWPNRVSLLMTRESRV